MFTHHSRYLQENKKLIEEEIERLKQILATGHSIIDYSAYRYHVGVISGLQRALELSEEAKSIANSDR